MLLQAYRETDWTPSRRELRIFGLTAGGALLVLATVLRWRQAAVLAWAPVGVCGLVLVVAGLSVPRRLLAVYRLWMAVTLPIGVFLQLLALAVVYYGVLTPVAFAVRLLRGDPLSRNADPEADTYWAPAETPSDPRRYFRQY